MMNIVEKGYGKINLALAITGRRADGYHNIDTIFQSIGLCDAVTVSEADVFELTCSQPSLACDETNLPIRLGRRFVRIKRTINRWLSTSKSISPSPPDWPAAVPIAPLSCAASTASGGWGCQKKNSAASVPASARRAFCICGGTMRGTGIGEELKRLPPLPAWPVVIVHPRVPVQTKQAYALFDSRSHTAPVAVDAVEQAVRAGDFQGLTVAMRNTFEELVIPNVPQVADCQQRLTALGLQPLMAGSGPTVFALVPPGQEEAVRSQTAAWHDVDVYMTAIVKRVEGER